MRLNVVPTLNYPPDLELVKRLKSESQIGKTLKAWKFVFNRFFSAQSNIEKCLQEFGRISFNFFPQAPLQGHSFKKVIERRIFEAYETIQISLMFDLW